MPDEEPRLARLRGICLSLPEAEAERSGRHAVFRVRRRRFAYFLDDHHGDGVFALACGAAYADQDALISAHPDRYFPPAYLGSRAWVGLRLDRGPVDWEEVGDLVVRAYRRAAPKRLAALLDEPGA